MKENKEVEKIREINNLNQKRVLFQIIIPQVIMKVIIKIEQEGKIQKNC